VQHDKVQHEKKWNHKPVLVGARYAQRLRDGLPESSCHDTLRAQPLGEKPEVMINRNTKGKDAL